MKINKKYNYTIGENGTIFAEEIIALTTERDNVRTMFGIPNEKLINNIDKGRGGHVKSILSIYNIEVDTWDDPSNGEVVFERGDSLSFISPIEVSTMGTSIFVNGTFRGILNAHIYPGKFTTIVYDGTKFTVPDMLSVSNPGFPKDEINATLADLDIRKNVILSGDYLGGDEVIQLTNLETEYQRILAIYNTLDLESDIVEEDHFRLMDLLTLDSTLVTEVGFFDSEADGGLVITKYYEMVNTNNSLYAELVNMRTTNATFLSYIDFLNSKISNLNEYVATTTVTETDFLNALLLDLEDISDNRAAIVARNLPIYNHSTGQYGTLTTEIEGGLDGYADLITYIGVLDNIYKDLIIERFTEEVTALISLEDSLEVKYARLKELYNRLTLEQYFIGDELVSVETSSATLLEDITLLNTYVITDEDIDLLVEQANVSINALSNIHVKISELQAYITSFGWEIDGINNVENDATNAQLTISYSNINNVGNVEIYSDAFMGDVTGLLNSTYEGMSSKFVEQSADATLISTITDQYNFITGVDGVFSARWTQVKDLHIPPTATVDTAPSITLNIGKHVVFEDSFDTTVYNNLIKCRSGALLMNSTYTSGITMGIDGIDNGALVTVDGAFITDLVNWKGTLINLEIESGTLALNFDVVELVNNNGLFLVKKELDTRIPTNITLSSNDTKLYAVGDSLCLLASGLVYSLEYDPIVGTDSWVNRGYVDTYVSNGFNNIAVDIFGDLCLDTINEGLFLNNSIITMNDYIQTGNASGTFLGLSMLGFVFMATDGYIYAKNGSYKSVRCGYVPEFIPLFRGSGIFVVAGNLAENISFRLIDIETL